MSPEEHLAAGVERHLYTGAVLLAGDAQAIRLEVMVGDHGDAQATPVTAASRFDLASLTKGVATALCVARLVADGELRWETPACALLPALKRGRHREITVEELLAHTSGLPDWAPLYRQRTGHEAVAAGGGEPPPAWRPAIVAAAARTPLLGRPGETFCYSDLGYILLGELVERAATASLTACLEAWVTGPLGLGDTIRFRAARPDAPGSERCVATEQCPWRGRRLAGEVHDENGWAMGGVAGHAGLFGTATAVATIAERLCAAVRGEDDWLPVEVARQVVARPAQGPAERWCRGFDRPSPEGSQAGTLLSRERGRGLLGFTGCSLWLDLATGHRVVLLTNRVHGGREDHGFRELRPAIHDACWSRLDREGSPGRG